MLENNTNQNAPLNGPDGDTEQYSDFLVRASQAQSMGKQAEALFYYLTAFEKARADSGGVARLSPTHPSVEGLRHAWEIACETNERSLAEYIYERIEPYLSEEELIRFSERLQMLALNKLKEFGLSPEDVEGVAGLLSEDLLGLKGFDFDIFPHMDMGDNPAEPVLPIIPESDVEGEQQEKEAALVSAEASAPPAPPASTSQALPSRAREAVEPVAGFLRYRDLIGYDEAIKTMHHLGFGLKEDSEFQGFIACLNKLHGLDDLPSYGTLLFRGPSRDDGDRLMLATAAELNLPTVRMYMDENPQGIPMLCVIASPNFKTQNFNFAVMEESAVLILENVDLWSIPVSEYNAEEFSPLSLMQLSRGVRRAITLIRAAVDNPHVTVLASAAKDGEIEDFMYDLLDPVTPVEVENPNVAERIALWDHIIEQHPSIRGVDKLSLVRLSSNMARSDIFGAAQEAVEEAYRESILMRSYKAVTDENIFERLAAYQTLDSHEYRELEDAVVEGFRAEIEAIEREMQEEK